jgi:alpha-tubulin suppressor-like RCC1 family protein
VDYSSARNDFGGWRNAPNHPNWSAFAVLKADGSIKAWGAPGFGTIGVPDGKGYTNIYSNTATFAALKSDGSIASWGSGSADMPSDSGYTYAPSDSGYTKIYSAAYAFLV